MRKAVPPTRKRKAKPAEPLFLSGLLGPMARGIRPHPVRGVRRRKDGTFCYTLQVDELAARREHFYRAEFAKAETDEKRADIAEAFLSDAPPAEWPLAGWLFDAIADWRGKAVSEAAADAGPSKSLKCLRRVVHAFGLGLDARSLRATFLNRSRSRSGKYPVDLEFYEQIKRYLAQIKQQYRWVGAHCVSPDKRWRLMEGMLKGHPKPARCPVDANYSFLRWCFELPVPKVSKPPRLGDGLEPREAALEFLKALCKPGQRVDRMARRLYSWIDCTPQDDIQKALGNRSRKS